MKHSPTEARFLARRQLYVDQIARIDSALALSRELEKEEPRIDKTITSARARVAADDSPRAAKQVENAKNRAAKLAGTRPIDRARRLFRDARKPLTTDALRTQLDLSNQTLLLVLRNLNRSSEIKSTRQGYVRTSKLHAARLTALDAKATKATKATKAQPPAFVRTAKLTAPKVLKRPIDRVRRVFLDASVALAPQTAFQQADAMSLRPRHQGNIIASMLRKREIRPAGYVNGTGAHP